MSKRKSIGWVATLAMAWAGSSAGAQTLGVGDPAPKLQVKSFIKGEPVKDFQAGKNYVVEFWATWCGPCKTSIPHLTKLQKEHPDIAFIGVSVFERDPSGVEPFVKEMGDKMDYRVAMDSDNAMADSWMKAAEQDGIPTAFIINKEGKIAWIGHPMTMDKPLENIIAGTWDIKAAQEEGRKKKDMQAAMMKIQEKLQKAQRSGDPQKLLSAIDEVISERPELEGQLIVAKLRLLIKVGDQDKILDLAKKLEKSPLGEQAEGLNFVAWSIVDPDSGLKPNEKLLGVALDFAQRADKKVDGKSGAIADTLAKAYFDTGDPAKALETQKRAIRLIKESGEPVDKGMQERLEQYRKAAGKK